MEVRDEVPRNRKPMTYVEFNFARESARCGSRSAERMHKSGQSFENCSPSKDDCYYFQSL